MDWPKINNGSNYRVHYLFATVFTQLLEYEL
jgi:hypothetical protein